jgi:competence protein ComEC
MNRFPIGKRELFLSLVLTLLVIIVQLLYGYFDTTTKIVFCDVGQGDGAYIRIHNRIDVVIDTGPDRKILNCLGKYMPFYDRTIELAFISHDQKDHFGGFDYLLDRYRIKKIYMPDIETSLESFKRLKQKMKDKKVRLQTLAVGMKIQIMGDVFFIHWPDGHCIAVDNNDCSLIFTFEEKYLPAGRQDFRALFTGDASGKVLNKIAVKDVTLLKIPHHGSKNGLTKTFLRLADPQVAVISVGKNNPYGHPSKQILDMLQSSKIKIKRTDKDGDVVFKLN